MKTPKRRLMDGEMYWIKPIADSGRRFAPLENKRRGMAVTAPPQTKSVIVETE